MNVPRYFRRTRPAPAPDAPDLGDIMKVNEFNKAMVALGKAARLAHRDIVRATRRPSLIHKGGKP